MLKPYLSRSLTGCRGTDSRRSCFALSWVLISCLQPGVSAGLAQDPATAATQYPLAVASHSGATYIADLKLPGVWRLQGEQAEVYFQGEKKFRTPLNAIRCLAVDLEGNLLAGDSATRNIYRFTEDGKPTAIVKNPVGIGIPMALATEKSGQVLVADLETHRIVRVNLAEGSFAPVAQVAAPRGLALDSQQRIWVISHGKDQVVRIGAENKVETVISGRPFQFPHHITFDSSGHAYVADGYGKAVWKLSNSAAEGEPEKWTAEKWVVNDAFSNPVGVAWVGDSLLLADPQANRLFHISAAGEVTVRLAATK